VSKAIAAGLDPQTPAIAASNVTRPDESYLSAPVAALPAAVSEARLAGPVLVMIGSVLSGKSRSQGNSPAGTGAVLISSL